METKENALQSENLKVDEMVEEKPSIINEIIHKVDEIIENHSSVNADTDKTSNEIAEAHLLLNERGDKLGDAEDATDKLVDNSKNFANLASELKKKYKDQKWYEF